MKEMTPKEMRYRLVLQQGVDGQLNRLVVQARELLDGFLQDGKGWQMGPTQMNNLLNVCNETGSVEVVIGYIQYQIGRDDKGQTWAWRDFGEALIKQLRDLKSQAGALVGKAAQQADYPLEGEREKREKDWAWMLLVHQYVGHLRRYFFYKKRPRAGGGR